jgi:site-specific recombinase XerD
VSLRTFPKSRAGQRVVPLPPGLTESLMNHRNRLVTEPDDADLVFPSRTGGPLRRNKFRRRVWLPSLARAGLIGQAEETDRGWLAGWRAKDGTQRAMCSSHQVAIGYIANNSLAALRFHELRHSYARWLVTKGLPVKVVRKVLGHEQASTTLDIYTHTPSTTSSSQAPDAFLLPPENAEADEDGEGDVDHMP